jgi:hypothetical protein
MPTDADLPPYDPARLLAAPFPERVRLVCRSFAAQAHPTPRIVMAMYWAKYFFLYVGGWAFFVSFSAGYPGFTAPGAWAFTAVAFQKAILWSLSELMGFGCGMGPMNALQSAIRRFPPLPAPGHDEAAALPGAPVIGDIRRSWLDVALYAAISSCSCALVAEITPALLWPSVV